jgi:hypothetical protein
MERSVEAIELAQGVCNDRKNPRRTPARAPKRIPVQRFPAAAGQGNGLCLGLSFRHFNDVSDVVHFLYQGV